MLMNKEAIRLLFSSLSLSHLMITASHHHQLPITPLHRRRIFKATHVYPYFHDKETPYASSFFSTALSPSTDAIYSSSSVGRLSSTATFHRHQSSSSYTNVYSIFNERHMFVHTHSTGVNVNIASVDETQLDQVGNNLA